MTMGKIQFKVLIKCGCGLTHSSFEAWTRCPMAMTPVAIDNRWWATSTAGEDVPGKER